MRQPILSHPRLGLLLAASVLSTPSHAADGFEKVRCDQPIVPALVGARSDTPNPVVRTEARRRSIGLKHLGAEIIDDDANTINWRICGRTFVVLDLRGRARDAVELPPTSREAPAFSTTACEVSGRKVEGTFLGVFPSNPGRGERAMPVRAAWRIDLKAGRFVPLDPAATCATDGIYVPNG